MIYFSRKKSITLTRSEVRGTGGWRGGGVQGDWQESKNTEKEPNSSSTPSSCQCVDQCWWKRGGWRHEANCTKKVQFNLRLACLSLSEELLSHTKSTGRHAEVTLALRYTLGQQVEAIISEVQSMLVAGEGFSFFMVVNVILQKKKKNVFFSLTNALFYSWIKDTFVSK